MYSKANQSFLQAVALRYSIKFTEKHNLLLLENLNNYKDNCENTVMSDANTKEV